jgi:hypothetical protein
MCAGMWTAPVTLEALCALFSTAQSNLKINTSLDILCSGTILEMFKILKIVREKKNFFTFSWATINSIFPGFAGQIVFPQVLNAWAVRLSGTARRRLKLGQRKILNCERITRSLGGGSHCRLKHKVIKVRSDSRAKHTHLIYSNHYRDLDGSNTWRLAYAVWTSICRLEKVKHWM